MVVLCISQDTNQIKAQIIGRKKYMLPSGRMFSTKFSGSRLELLVVDERYVFRNCK